MNFLASLSQAATSEIIGGAVAEGLIHELESFLGIPHKSLLPLDQVDDDMARRLAMAVERRWDDFVALVSDQQEREGIMAIPVAATVVMALGANMTDMFHKAAVAAGQIDELAPHSASRRICMDDYVEALLAYRPGERLFLPTPWKDRLGR